MKNRRQSTCGIIATWTSLNLLGRFLPVLAVLLLAQVALARPNPTPDDAFAAYRLVDGWVRAWSVPPAEPGPKAVGACVTLKYNGVVIARGAAWSSSLTGSDAGESGVLRRAAADAIKDATPKLNIPNDAMRDEALRQIAQDVTISVELAGPLSLAEPTTWEDAELTFRPGLDGIGVRIVPTATGVAPGPLIAVFPSQMLLTNQLPHRALSRALAEAIGEGGAAAALDDPSKIRDKHAMKMYRFRVQQVVQPTPQADAVSLYRGQKWLSPTQPMTSARLEKMAEDLERWLIQDVKSYVAGRGEDLERATLALLAIDRLAEWRATKSKARYRYAVVNEVVHWSRRVQLPREEKEDLAYWKVLASTLNVLGDESCGNDLLRTREGIWGPADQLVNDPSGDVAGHVALPKRALAQYLLAWIELPQHITTKPEFFKHLTKTQSEMWSEIGVSGAIAHMPWLGWTDFELDRQGSKNSVADAPKPALVAYRQMRSDCWQHQIGIASATDDTLDMIGGIVFTKGLGQGGAGGGNPYPTWQCVRPLAFIATMLGDKRLTEPAERPGEIARLMLALRFLRQLQVDEASAWMYDNPSAALGGIRVSTWDNTVSTDATALTLLCVVETLKSLDAIAAEQAQQPAPAPGSAPSGAAPTSPAPTPK